MDSTLLRRLSHSLIFRAGITMVGITLLAITSMIAALVVADVARQDAAALNLAGSLRLHAYRLANNLYHQPLNQDAIQIQIVTFESRLEDPLLESHVAVHADAAAQALEAVRTQWYGSMKPALERLGHTPDQAGAAYLAELEGFVEQVDGLVGLIQSKGEQRLHVLRLIQGIALFLTLALVAVAMYKLLTQVVPPLRELFRAVELARTGDFSLRPRHRGLDEIGLLSQTYSLMAEDLSRLYADLEQRVADKTAALTRSNQALRLLYETARQLGRDALGNRDYQTILEKVGRVIGLGPLSLCLTTENADRAYRRIQTPAADPADDCRNDECAVCLNSPGLADPHCPRPGLLSVPVREADRQYGVILLEHPPQTPPEPWHVELVEAVAAQIAAALSLAGRQEQQHRLALMDERAVIARELHDSLAQSLSYLKIQVARLQTLISRTGADDSAMNEVIAELKEGLNSAYRQLRELLSTFRLKMNEAGLESALESTAAEFSARGDLHVSLDYRLQHCPLSPNEEIHVLQVVREAMANILHHAQASEAEIRLEVTDQAEVRATILDNGVGIPDNWQRRNHYGVAIMQERSQSLGGSLRLERRPEGGTRVELRFRPRTDVDPLFPSSPGVSQ